MSEPGKLSHVALNVRCKVAHYDGYGDTLQPACIQCKRCGRWIRPELMGEGCKGCRDMSKIPVRKPPDDLELLTLDMTKTKAGGWVMRFRGERWAVVEIPFVNLPKNCVQYRLKRLGIDDECEQPRPPGCGPEPAVKPTRPLPPPPPANETVLLGPGFAVVRDNAQQIGELQARVAQLEEQVKALWPV